jgi:hypothetical protein
MKAPECVFEEDVLAAALQSRWPDRVAPELREHVESCTVCADLALVARNLTELNEASRSAVNLPDAGRIWWKTQLRLRREAVDAAGRPITAAHVLALGCAAGLAGACFGASSTWFQSALRWIGSRGDLLHVSRMLIVEHGAVAAATVIALFVLPAAVYLAIGRD